MRDIRTALVRLAAENPSIRATVLPLTRKADKWKSMPKGWDDDSRKKFWNSLTGDNKHKVTKCIEQMKGKDGIDDPGAFCAALADRVMGPDWRKKKASLAGTYADYVFRGEQEFLQDCAKLIKKQAGGYAEKVEVIRNGGRSPFLVYKGQDRSDMDLDLTIHVFSTSQQDVTLGWFGTSAMRGRIDGKASYKWGQLKPSDVLATFVNYFGAGSRLASLDDVDTKVAFNKYNAPEVMGQLIKLLQDNGLDDAVDLLKRHKIPQAVDKAWKNREKKAARLALLRSKRRRLASVDTKTAADIRKVLGQLFQGHQPYVRDWGRFLRELAEDITNWPDAWSSAGSLEAFKASPGSTDYHSWMGRQIGGYGYRGNRGFDPPEYEEHDVEVADTVHLSLGIDLHLRTFPKAFLQTYKHLVKDASGFLRATADLVSSQSSVEMLGKLLRAGFLAYVKGDPAATAEWVWDDIEDVARDMTEGQWDVQYRVRDMKVPQVKFKATGTGLRVWGDAIVHLDVESVEPPEPDYEPDDYEPDYY